MNSNMLLLFAPLCFLLCWMLPVDSMMVHLGFPVAHANQPLPLNMVPNAVDDMFSGCHRKMAKKIKYKYFKKEYHGIFADVWKHAETCTKKKLPKKKPKHKALNRQHMQAICVYTSNYKKFYASFNDHIRNDRSKYGSSFQFHSLYFWLTSALQIINQKQCHTTYRRTDITFTGSINQKMRFGFFASSSYMTSLSHFGHSTCFIIRTCTGGFLDYYSDFGDIAKEVLIPPYEVFKITDVKPGYYVQGLTDCKIVYTLVSVGVQSNLNCKAVKW